MAYKAGDGHSQRWRVNNPTKNRQYYLSTMYGITPGEYDTLFEKQGGLCAICGSEKPGRTKTSYFYVDHDHTTGKIRGLLCHHCNLILGQAFDKVEVLESAIRYLKNV